MCGSHFLGIGPHAPAECRWGAGMVFYLPQPPFILGRRHFGQSGLPQTFSIFPQSCQPHLVIIPPEGQDEEEADTPYGASTGCTQPLQEVIWGERARGFKMLITQSKGIY